MNGHENVIATFKDKFGEIRKIHKTKTGLKVLRDEASISERLANAIGELVGLKIRQIRKSKKMTMNELGKKTGLAPYYAKARVHEVETGKVYAGRGRGIKIGTLYLFARALDVHPVELLPSPQEAFALAGLVESRELTLIYSEIS